MARIRMISPPPKVNKPNRVLIAVNSFGTIEIFSTLLGDADAVKRKLLIPPTGRGRPNGRNLPARPKAQKSLDCCCVTSAVVGNSFNSLARAPQFGCEQR